MESLDSYDVFCVNIIKLSRGRYRWEKTKHYVLSGNIWYTPLHA